MKLKNEIVIEIAKELGFDLVGFASASLLQNETDHLNEWLSGNYHASMDYMARNFDKRKDVTNILPGAKSVISLAMNYYTSPRHLTQTDFPADEKSGKVSRYAWGKDYHLILWEKLELLEKELKKIEPSFECLTYADTGPVMDKAWAVRAGIGWQGKHSNIISREMGSWFFLATVISNCDFEYGRPIEDFCGSCTACIEACPTKAIVKDYVVDANRCISFLTIENKKEISPQFKDNFDNWIFGCDICQDVCPWNKKFSLPAKLREFEPAGNKELSLRETEEMTLEIFKSRFETSPIKRAKLSGLKRNASFLRSSD